MSPRVEHCNVDVGGCTGGWDEDLDMPGPCSACVASAEASRRDALASIGGIEWHAWNDARLARAGGDSGALESFGSRALAFGMSMHEAAFPSPSAAELAFLEAGLRSRSRARWTSGYVALALFAVASLYGACWCLEGRAPRPWAPTEEARP